MGETNINKDELYFEIMKELDKIKSLGNRHLNSDVRNLSNKISALYIAKNYNKKELRAYKKDLKIKTEDLKQSLSRLGLTDEKFFCPVNKDEIKKLFANIRNFVKACDIMNSINELNI